MKRCLSGGHRREEWSQKGRVCAKAKNLERIRHTGGKVNSSVCAACKGQRSRGVYEMGFFSQKVYSGGQVEEGLGGTRVVCQHSMTLIRNLYNI